MSSHHFVKEGQEPALFILEPLSLALAQPLLEWAPLVIVIDEALEDVLRWGIKVDVVIALAHEVETVTLKLTDQAPVKILAYQSGEDPIGIAFNFFSSTKQASVNILSGQPDTIIPSVSKFTRVIDVSIITEQLRWSAITSGSYKKWLPSGTALLIKSAESVRVEELKPEGEPGKFITTRDGIVTILSDSVFWVGEGIESESPEVRKTES